MPKSIRSAASRPRSAKRGTKKSRQTRPAKKTKSKSTAKALPSRAAPIEFDWNGVATSANAHRFEDLALDLFAERYDEDKFTPNARRPGKDGGVDGLYRGTLFRVAGPWKVACAVRSKYAAVERKVKEENALARKAKQRGLFFITSYDGTAVEVAKLQRLAERGLDGARVWCRAQLERLLRDLPWLRQRYFGHQVVPGFVPADLSTEGDDQGQPDLELVGRTTEVDLLRAHIAGAPRIIAVVAAGGAGKTRLLRALPALLKGIRPARTAWLRRAGQGTIDAALQSGLPARRPLLLALDDAAQSLAEVDELKRLATSTGPVDAKIVLAIRAVDRSLIEERIAGARDAIRWIELADLSEDDGAKIAKLECPGLSQRNAKRLARAFGSNLFLLRAAAQLVENGESPARVVDDQVLRGIVARRLIAEAGRHLQPLADPRSPTMLLAELALHVPIPFGRGTEDLAVSVLRHAGLLRRVGNTLRFRRDVEGDVLLAYLLEHASERAIIERLVFATPYGADLPHQIRNLGAAGRGHAAELIRAVIASWRADPDLPRAVHRVWPLLRHCAASAPDEVAELCIHAATIASPDTDDVGPVVLALAVSDVSRALRVAGAIADLGVRRGMYSNYHVHGIARTLTNRRFHRPPVLATACEVLATWLNASVLGPRVPLLSAVLDGFFDPVMRWDEADGVSVSSHELPLGPTPSVLELRRAALTLLATMLGHADRDVRLGSVDVLRRHGGPGGGRTSNTALDAAASEEFDSLADLLGARLHVEPDIRVLAALRATLATRWAAVRPGAGTAARLLSRSADDPLVKAYHYASDATEWFYDFEDVLARAPPEESQRWSWWVRTFMFNRRDDAERGRLADDLCAAFPGPDDVLRCVSVLASAVNASLVLEAWCDRAPATFEAAFSDATGAQQRELLGRVLRRRRYRNDPTALLRDLKELPPTADPSVVRNMLADDARRTAGVAVELARYLAGLADPGLRVMSLDTIGHRSDVPPSEVMDILEDVLRDGDWRAYWHAIWTTLHPTDRADLLTQRPTLRARLEDQLAAAGSSGDAQSAQLVLDELFAHDDGARLAFLRRVVAVDSFDGAYRIGRLASPLVSELGRLRLLATEFVHWVAELGATGETAIAGVLSTALADSRKFADGAFELARDMVGTSERNAQRVAVLLLGEMQDSPPACALLAELAVGPDASIANLAGLALDQFDIPRGGWSHAAGEPSVELVALRDTLETAMSLAAKGARARLEKVVRSIEAQIASDLRADEELLTPS